MKVKYFSEVLNKYYDSEEEVLDAEKEFNERKLKEENKKKELANNKKVMASAIEKAQKELELAEEELEKANRQAEEVFSKAYEDALALIKPAKDKVEDCQKAKYQAIKEFNKVNNSLKNDNLDNNSRFLLEVRLSNIERKLYRKFNFDIRN